MNAFACSILNLHLSSAQSYKAILLAAVKLAAACLPPFPPFHTFIFPVNIVERLFTLTSTPSFLPGTSENGGMQYEA